jgi:uncharacterized membrane protein
LARVGRESKVGGSSEVEVGEKKDQGEDAFNATRAAVELGIMTFAHTTSPTTISEKFFFSLGDI